MKVVGKARALARGYYPVSEKGNCKIIEEGEEFDLYEGHTKGKWFERMPANKSEAQRPPKPEQPPLA